MPLVAMVLFFASRGPPIIEGGPTALDTLMERANAALQQAATKVAGKGLGVRLVEDTTARGEMFMLFGPPVEPPYVLSGAEAETVAEQWMRSRSPRVRNRVSVRGRRGVEKYVRTRRPLLFPKGS